MTDPELAIRRGMPADSRGCYDVFLPEVAMTHLLGRRFRMDTFFTFLLSSRPFGRFDRFIGFAPPFVL